MKLTRKSCVFKALLILSFLPILGSCSKSNPVVVKEEVQPEPTQVETEEAIFMVLDAAHDENLSHEKLNEILTNIEKHYSTSFNWAKFWFELSEKIKPEEVTLENLVQINRLQKISCATDTTISYFQFIEGLMQSKDHSGKVLELAGNRINTCRSYPSVNTLKAFNDFAIRRFREFGAIGDTLAYLHFISQLELNVTKNELKTILSESETQDWRKISDILLLNDQTDHLVGLLTILNDLFPFERSQFNSMAYEALKKAGFSLKLLKTIRVEQVSKLVMAIPKEDLMRKDSESMALLLENLTSVLHEENTSTKLGERSDSTREALFLSHLDKQKVFFQLLVRVFDQKNDLREKILGLLHKANSSLETLIVQDSALSKNLLANEDREAANLSWLYFRHLKRNYREELSAFEAPRLEQSILERITKARILTSLKRMPVKTYCNLLNEIGFSHQKVSFKDIGMAGGEIFSKLRPGCFSVEVTKNDLGPLRKATLTINSDSDFTMPLDSVLIAPGVDVTIKAARFDGTIIDLSADKSDPKRVTPETTKDHDGMVVPIVFGITPAKMSNLYSDNETYFFPYHYQLKMPSSELPATSGMRPNTGYPGGDLTLKQQEDCQTCTPATLISLGGEGQEAADGRAGGKGQLGEMSQYKLEEFIFVSDFEGLKTEDKSLLSSSLSRVKDLYELLTVAPRNSQGQVITYLPSDYINYFDQAQLNRFDDNMENFLSTAPNNCPMELGPKRKCFIELIAKDAAEDLQQDVFRLYSEGVREVLTPGVTFNFKQRNGLAGDTYLKGEQGKNGREFYEGF